MIAHCPLDGDAPTDALGNGNDGTIGGDVVTGADGAAGSSFEFDGDGDYVHYPKVDATYDGSADWATSLWINPDTLTPDTENPSSFILDPRGHNDI